MTKCYRVKFVGRRVGAIGIRYNIETLVFAASEDDARNRLYERFEHISAIETKEWESPFSGDGLVLLVNNDRDLHEHLCHLANQLVSLVSRAAIKAAKANAEWHDDPEAEDHGLYHDAVEMQYPAEEQILAAAELILGRLRETPAGLAICNQLLLPGGRK